MPQFSNDDARLLERAEEAREERRRAGLEGLVCGLEAVVVNIEPDRQADAVQEFLGCTGYEFRGAFQDRDFTTCVLKLRDSADFLFRTRLGQDNPFLDANRGPKSSHLPNTRLETFVYACPDVARYTDIQQGRGVEFLTPAPVRTDNYLFIQTPPSPYTGNSTGFIQWLGSPGEYTYENCDVLDWSFPKPGLEHLGRIGRLDHSATRVKAEERDDAIIEFMNLTNYDFHFAVHVDSLNSITNVARLSAPDYAQVFTSGVKAFVSELESGPTEKFIYNFGARVHHLAFETDEIEATFQALKDNGMEFLLELVGSPREGLKQTFSAPSPHTLLVNEYISRYDGFDGFFTRSNVTKLTKATEKQ